jgi:hypothetical protein
MTGRGADHVPPPDVCTDAPWCEKPRDHDGLHRAYIHEIILDWPGRGSVALTVEGSSATLRYPAIAISGPNGQATATLQWTQADQLGRALQDVVRRHRTDDPTSCVAPGAPATPFRLE